MQPDDAPIAAAPIASGILRRIREIEDQLHRTIMVRPEMVEAARERIRLEADQLRPLTVHVLGSDAVEPGQAYVVPGRPLCACVAYTTRTDYGTGIEHDVDRSSCPIHSEADDQ